MVAEVDQSLPMALSSGTGVANLPNQRHKIVAKQGAKFTLMVCGESGVGKTTYINTLFASTLMDPKNQSARARHKPQTVKTTQIQITRTEIVEQKFKVTLTIVDTPGFGDYVNNRNSWNPIVDFIDDQHEQYMRQEQQPRRQGIVDMRVHACLYFIKPTGHTLSPLDIECMKRLGSRVNLIPVIAKADTLLPADLWRFKQNIRETIAAQGIQVYSCPIESDDEAVAQRNASIMSAMPFSVIGSTQDVKTGDGKWVKGRSYSWGVAEVENDDHCDFRKLRSLLVRTHMLDLITTTNEIHYENYRQRQMETRPLGDAAIATTTVSKQDQQAILERIKEEMAKCEDELLMHQNQLMHTKAQLQKELDYDMERVRELQAQVSMYQNTTYSSPKSSRR